MSGSKIWIELNKSPKDKLCSSRTHMCVSLLEPSNIRCQVLGHISHDLVNSCSILFVTCGTTKP